MRSLHRITIIVITFLLFGQSQIFASETQSECALIDVVDNSFLIHLMTNADCLKQKIPDGYIGSIIYTANLSAGQVLKQGDHFATVQAIAADYTQTLIQLYVPQIEGVEIGCTVLDVNRDINFSNLLFLKYTERLLKMSCN